VAVDPVIHRMRTCGCGCPAVVVVVTIEGATVELVRCNRCDRRRCECGWVEVSGMARACPRCWRQLVLDAA
jgi:hypothetical protein